MHEGLYFSHKILQKWDKKPLINFCDLWRYSLDFKQEEEGDRKKHDLREYRNYFYSAIFAFQ